MKYVFEVRRALEMEAVRLACERRSDDDVRLLRELAAKRDVPAENFVDVDLAFHIAVVDAAHNPVLTDLFAGILETVRATYEVTEGVHPPSLTTSSHHQGSCRSHCRTRCHQSQGGGMRVSREDSGSDRFRFGGYRVRASANRLRDPAMSSAFGVVIVRRSPPANVTTTAGPVRVTTP